MWFEPHLIAGRRRSARRGGVVQLQKRCPESLGKVGVSMLDLGQQAVGRCAEGSPELWSFDARADLEAVVRIEFPDAVADPIVAHRGNSVSYSYRLFSRLY
jgi:hypothetical protein